MRQPVAMSERPRPALGACPRLVLATGLAMGVCGCASLLGADFDRPAATDAGVDGTSDDVHPGDDSGQEAMTDGQASAESSTDSAPVDAIAPSDTGVDGGSVVLFGGQDDTTTYGDTEIWNGQTWTTATLTKSPPSRSFASAATANNAVVVFGGYDSNGDDLADTWSWSASSWTNWAAPGPSARDSVAMTGNAVGAVLFGGKSAASIFSDMWQWGGASWTLLSVTDGGTGPSPRWGTALASLHGTIVLFGGKVDGNAHVSDTWIWNGTSWTEAFPAQSPPACSYASMVTLNDKAILFGCSGAATWQWDGSAWTMVADSGPSARNAAAVAVYDGKIVLFGGVAGSTYLGDTWEWDGSTWTEKTPTASPAPRAYASMAALP
jgi:hypothetical protein